MGADKSTLKKTKTVPSAGKVMTTFFCDTHGVVRIYYVKKRTTGEYFALALDKLKGATQGKRPHLKQKIMRFHT